MEQPHHRRVNLAKLFRIFIECRYTEHSMFVTDEYLLAIGYNQYQGSKVLIMFEMETMIPYLQRWLGDRELC